MQTKIAILGAGESGVGAALLAKSKGYDVFVSDFGKIADGYKKELSHQYIEFEEGGHSEEKISLAQEVIKSPGIPDSASIVQYLNRKEIPIIGDIEFAGRYSKAYMVGITGSNGKTTCVLWLDYILKLAGMDSVLAGNVGVSPCRTLVKRDPAYFVMELSSFQLDSMSDFRCNIAVLTNITPDHLDRYDHNIEKYIQSKLRIVQNQRAEDLFIFSADDPILSAHLNQKNTPAQRLPFSLGVATSGRIENEELVVSFKDSVFKMRLDEVALKGKHNIYNAMAVGLCALNMDVSPELLRKGLSTFKGVEHRLEYVEEIEGVLYINDSKATNVDSAFYALESMTRPVIWIAGGTDKGNDYSDLVPLVSKKVKALICMGVDNSKLLQTFSDKVPYAASTSSIADALYLAKQNAEHGDVVLLSPACASFDLFKNYEHRGDLFKKGVLKMKIS